MESAIESKKLQELLLVRTKNVEQTLSCLDLRLLLMGSPSPNACVDRPIRSMAVEHVEIGYCFTYFCKI